MSQYELRMLHSQTGNNKHIHIYKCTKNVIHLKKNKLQILIYKFIIAKLQCQNCHNTNYEYCIYILHITSIQMIDTSMLTSLHLTLYKCTFTEEGFTNVYLPISNHKVAKLEFWPLCLSIADKQNRSTEGYSKFKSPDTKQVQGRLVSTLKHL